MGDSDAEMRRMIIIAGPNGAGKTTFARQYLPNEGACPAFLNADLIAAGLSPFDPAVAAVRAGRLMLREIDEHVRRRESFAFETTLSGRGYLRRIAQWRRAGFHVDLAFLTLPTPDAALRRVAQRVLQGGHNVATELVVRRFHLERYNYKNIYRPVVDSWIEYDHSGQTPIVTAEGRFNA